MSDVIDARRLAPEAYAQQAAFERAAWAGLGDPALAELLKVRVSQLNGCGFCLDLHHRGALAAGVPQRKLHLVAGWRDAPVFDARERAALALADASVRSPHPAPDAAERAAAREHFTDAELAGLLLGLAGIGSWNRIALATGLAFPADDAAADRMAARMLGHPVG